ncbi:MAG: hypothetical protein ACPGR8_16705 [Limisphaerales bacterium]
MGWINYVPVQSWPLAMGLAIFAEICNGFAQLEIRRGILPNTGLIALMFAQLGSLMAVPALSPPLVTGISGFAVLLVVSVAYKADKTGGYTIAFAGLLVLGVLLVALDVAVNGEQEAKPATDQAYTAFWVVSAICSVATATCTAYTNHAAARVLLMIGCGCQDVISTSLVYSALAPPGSPNMLPVLLASGIFGLYADRQSLRVNKLATHIATAFATYNTGIWLASPAISSMTIHGGPLSIVGGILCIGAAAPLLWLGRT